MDYLGVYYLGPIIMVLVFAVFPAMMFFGSFEPPKSQSRKRRH